MKEPISQPVRVAEKAPGKVEQARATVKKLSQEGIKWFEDKWKKVTGKKPSEVRQVLKDVEKADEKVLLADEIKKPDQKVEDTPVKPISVAEMTGEVAEPIEEKTINLDDLDHIMSIPVFASGNEKRYRKFTELEGKVKVIAEYKKPVSADFLKATTDQQRILHDLFPERFILNIYDQQIGSDGFGRFVTDFVEIDPVKSVNVTKPSFDLKENIEYTAAIRNSPEFRALIPELKEIGFIPEKESLEGDRIEINEVAGNTIFDDKGNQIIVDVTTPYVTYYIDGNQIVRPRLDVEKVIKFAQQKGVYENMREAIEEYRVSGKNAAHEQQKYLDDTPVWKI